VVQCIRIEAESDGAIKHMIPRIYADANDISEGGCLMLHIAGALKDIERYRGQLQPGMRALFNVQDEFEVEER
jgi:hypothetical protein